jgi:hypothetical protein
MDPRELRVGDRIRIVGIPGEGMPGYFLHRDTRRVYKLLIARRRSVRIYEIDGYGYPWYQCRFRTRNGQWEYHSLMVAQYDNNWIKVKSGRVK